MRPHKPAEGLPTPPNAADWPARVLHGAPALLTYLDSEQRFSYVNDTHRRWLDHGAAIDALSASFGGDR